MVNRIQIIIIWQKTHTKYKKTVFISNRTKTEYADSNRRWIKSLMKYTTRFKRAKRTATATR